MRYWIFRIVLLIPLAFMFVPIGSEGLRRLWPPLGARIHRLPFLSFLEEYEEFHHIDAAHLASLCVVTYVSILWDSLIEALVLTDIAQMDHDPSVHSVRNRLFLFLVAPLVIFGEAVLFFRGAQVSGGWGRSTGSFDAFIGTIVYISLIAAGSYFTVKNKYSRSSRRFA